MISKRSGLIVRIALVAVALGLYAFSRLSSKPDNAEAPAARETTSVVQFLMEQQWRIRMKLALAEEKLIAHRITATGRVIPAANHHAAVAPAVSGLIKRGPLPRLGQRVAAGQTIAVLRAKRSSKSPISILSGSKRRSLNATWGCSQKASARVSRPLPFLGRNSAERSWIPAEWWMRANAPR